MKELDKDVERASLILAEQGTLMSKKELLLMRCQTELQVINRFFQEDLILLKESSKIRIVVID